MTTASLIKSDPDALTSLLLACLTALTYDWCITLDQEISLYTSHPPNLGTLLFVFNRYAPFVENIVSLYTKVMVLSPESCAKLTATYTWFIVLGIIVAEIILMLRTYAIWNRSRRILYTLIGVGVVVVVLGIITTELEIRSLHFANSPTPGAKGCFISGASSIIFVSYLVSLVSETVIVILTAAKAVSHLRRSRAPWMITLYRDGFVFYMYCLMLSLANILLTVAGPAFLRNWLATPQHVVHSICCTRVFFFIYKSRRQHDTISSATAGQSTSFSTQLFTSFMPVQPTTPPGDCSEEFAMIGMPPSDYHDSSDMASFVQVPTTARPRAEGMNFVPVHDNSHDLEHGVRFGHDQIYLESRIP